MRFAKAEAQTRHLPEPRVNPLEIADERKARHLGRAVRPIDGRMPPERQRHVAAGRDVAEVGRNGHGQDRGVALAFTVAKVVHQRKGLAADVFGASVVGRAVREAGG